MKSPGLIFFSDAAGLQQQQRYAYVAWRVWGVAAIASLAWAAAVVRKADWTLLMLLAVIAEAAVVRLASTRFQLWDSTLFSFGALYYVLAQCVARILGVAVAVAGYYSAWATLALGVLLAGIWSFAAASYVKSAPASFFVLSCLATSGTIFAPRVNFLCYAYAPSVIVILSYDRSARGLLVMRVASALALVLV